MVEGWQGWVGTITGVVLCTVVVLPVAALAVWALVARRRGTLFRSRPLLRVTLWMGPAGRVAMLAGWFTTEIGRQPWVVYGLMRTAEGVSDHGVGQLATTLILFVIVYFVVFGAGTVYFLRLIALGPVTHEGERPVPGGPGQPRTPARPLSAAPDPGGSPNPQSGG